MKVCFLEVTPKGPLEGSHRDVLIDKFGKDYYFVNHDEDSDGCFSFNKGFKWAQNRNYLAANIPQDYDYYWFSDYDVNYQSQTELDEYDQIIKDLNEMQPGVMVCYDPTKNDSAYKPYSGKSFSTISMSNNHMKIVHKSLLDWFFPMPTQFGGIWDACHYFNILETPFKESVVCTYNVFCQGLVSEPRSQGNHQAMDNLHKELNNCMVPSLRFPSWKDAKNHFITQTKNLEPIPFTPEKTKFESIFDVEKLSQLR